MVSLLHPSLPCADFSVLPAPRSHCLGRADVLSYLDHSFGRCRHSSCTQEKHSAYSGRRRQRWHASLQKQNWNKLTDYHKVTTKPFPCWPASGRGFTLPWASVSTTSHLKSVLSSSALLVYEKRLGSGSMLDSDSGKGLRGSLFPNVGWQNQAILVSLSNPLCTYLNTVCLHSVFQACSVGWEP